jgi:hypothetical protein
MGLFDHIEVAGSLIGSPAESLVFQTKSLDCMMENYRISKLGRLEMQEYTIEDRGDKAAPAGSIQRIAGCKTHVPTGVWRDLNWHGFIEFHDIESAYVAKFTDGQLVNVERSAA